MSKTIELLPDIKLRLNIDHPTFEECYTHGYDAAVAELSERDNPFPEHSRESDFWLEGWWAGFYGEAPWFDSEDCVADHAEPLAIDAANDRQYELRQQGFWSKVIEITGVIAVSALVGYQVIDLVA